MKIETRIWLVWTTAVLAVLWGLLPAQALTVNPARTEVRLPPGAIARSTITISNETGLTVHVQVSKKDWFVMPENSSWTAKTWLFVEAPARLDLKAGERRVIPIELRCPGAAQGDLVAMVSFRYEGDAPSMVTPMISVSVYMTVAGTERMSGVIEEVQARRASGGLAVGALLKATGNVHLRPSGTIVIDDHKDQEVIRYSLREGEPVYPGRLRAYAVQDANMTLDPGHYTTRIDLAYRETHWQAKRGFKVLPDGKIQMDPDKKSL